MKLNRAERLYWYAPFWGLDGSIPDSQLIDTQGTVSAWLPMELDGDYDEDATTPVGATGDPQWYRVLLAGPDATSNPAGTVVVNTSSKIRYRVIAGNEVDILPDRDEWILLTT